jgi:hypothetical protein
MINRLMLELGVPYETLSPGRIVTVRLAAGWPAVPAPAPAACTWAAASRLPYELQSPIAGRAGRRASCC